MKSFLLCLLGASTVMASPFITETLSTASPEILWQAENSAVKAVQVDGESLIQWTLEAGKSATLKMKEDHAIFSRLRYFERLEFEFRIAKGKLDSMEFTALGHVSGSRQFKIHQWQLAILTTENEAWHTRQLDLNRPNWFPWDNPDGNHPHFQFAALAIEPGTVVELRNVRLMATPLVIKPFFEYPITWPLKTEEADGSATYTFEVPVMNISGKPATLTAKLISEHKHFRVTVEPESKEVKNGDNAIFTVTAELPAAESKSLEELYAETIRIGFANAEHPETVSTFEMPVTRPLSKGLNRQVVLAPEDLKFVRERLAAGDETIKKALNYDRIIAEADKFLGIRLDQIPRNPPYGRINYWPTVPGSEPKVRYEIGSFMPEIVNPVTGEREVGTPLADRVWREYLAHSGQVTENLGMAYVLTGEEKYAAKAVELLQLWAKHYQTLPWNFQWEPSWSNGPAPLAASRIAPNSSYGGNWALRWHMRMLGLIGDSPSLTPEARQKIYEGLVLPFATETAKFPGGISNMTDIANHNLLVMGIVFDDANLVRWALHTDPGLLSRLRDIDEDGFSSEGRPTNYHIAAMKEYLPSLAYLKNSGLNVELPADRLLAAVRMLYSRATLWGVIPNIGDCGRGAFVSNTPLADDLLALFEEEAWLQDIGRDSNLVAKIRRQASNRPVQKEGYKQFLETKPKLFRNAGLAILRTGDTPETQIMATLDYGRNPMHGHLDRNQITLAAFGKTFTHGPGTIYNAGRGGIVLTEDKQLGSFGGAGSLGQNVILVDEQNQLPAIGELLAWSDDPKNQFATSRVPGIAPGVNHTRALILRDGLVVVIDQIESDEEHTYDFVYHNLGKLEPQTGWTGQPVDQPLAQTANYPNIGDLHRLSGTGPLRLEWNLENQVSALAKTPPPPVSARLGFWQLPIAGREVYTGITGMNNPNTALMPDSAPSVFTRVRGKNVTFVTVLEPYQEAPQITSVEEKQGRLVIHRKNGTTEIIYPELGLGTHQP